MQHNRIDVAKVPPTLAAPLKRIGYGRRSQGGVKWGNYPTVLYIDNLTDGSFRQMVEQTSGPRLIRPLVSGWIDLSQPDALAPEGGDVMDGEGTIEIDLAWNGHRIGIRGGGIRFNAPHSILRNARIYRGPEPHNIPGGRHTGDCVHIGPAATDIIIDHCSLAFSTDELLGIRGQRVTVQWTTLTHPLNNPPHQPEQNHGYACLISETANQVTIRNTLFANSFFRNPAVSAGDIELMNVAGVNCNTQVQLQGVNKPYRCNASGMVFVQGPDSRTDHFRIHPSAPVEHRNYWCSPNNLSIYKDWGVEPYGKDRAWFSHEEGTEMAFAPFELAGTTAFDARNTLAAIRRHAGTEPYSRDAYMVGVMAEFTDDYRIDATGRIIDLPDDLAYPGLDAEGYPNLGY